MIVLDVDYVTNDSCRLCSKGGDDKNIVRLALHSYSVTGRCVLNHIPIGCQRMKRRRHSHHNHFCTKPFGKRNAVHDGFASQR